MEFCKWGILPRFAACPFFGHRERPVPVIQAVSSRVVYYLGRPGSPCLKNRQSPCSKWGVLPRK